MVISLVERDAQLAALEAAAAAPGQVVLLQGEAGSGKTALVRAFRDTLDHRHAFRMGRCDPLATPAPLGPLYDMLATFSPSVGDMLATSGDRHRLFATVCDEITAERSVTVIDDVHFAGEATIDLIRYLGRRIPESPSLLICAYRPGEIDRTHPLRAALGEMGHAAVRIELPMLTVAGVTAMAKGADVDPLDLYSVSGGNPLFVTQMLAHPGEHLPASLADAVVGLAHSLPASAWELLDMVALSPEGLPLDVIEQLGKHTEVDRAVAIGLLEIEKGRVGCRHDLIRRALDAVLPPARRLRVHRLLLDLLTAGPVRPVDLSALAHHAVQGGAAEPAAALSLGAARQAAADGSHREAVAHYTSALRFGSHLPVGERRAALIASSYELYLTGRLDESWEQAVEVLEGANTEVEQGRALRWMSRLAWFRGRRDEALEHGQKAVAVLEAAGSDDHELAYAYSNLSQLAMLDQDPEGTKHWGVRALEIARRIDDVEVIAHALNNIGTVEGWRHEDGSRALEESLTLSLAGDLTEHAARAFTNLSYQLLWRGEIDRASEYLRRGLAFCEGSDLDTWWWYMRGARCRLLLTSGRWEEARREADAVLASQSVPIMRHDALTATARLLIRQGDPGAREAAMEAVEVGRGIAEYSRLVLSASVAAEAMWMGLSVPPWVDGWIRDVLDDALRRSDTWGASEIAFWLLRRRLALPEGKFAQPVTLELEERGSAASEAWDAVGFVVEAAITAALFGGEDRVREAFRCLGELGAEATLQVVRSELRAAGTAGLPRGPIRRTRSNPAGLTDRQLDVLECLREGMSNADVAAALYITPKTAEHHVSAVLSKLGARTRGEAVAIALDRAILD